MLHIPILRQGKPYESIDRVEIVHHATGDPVALVSQANAGMIVRDVHRMDDTVLERFSVVELLSMAKKAADLYMSASLPLGDTDQTFEQYIEQLSATTGMPLTYCKVNAQKIHCVLADMDKILAGFTRGFDLEILDKGYGDHNGCTLSYFREGRIFGAVLPSNSPGVHGLWIPAIVLKAPIVLKPGREEPWTPYRVIEALCAAGVPREAFGFYPTDHAGSGELLRTVDRSMLFGGEATTKPYENNPRVQLHGPGFSKVILGDDTADDWEKYLDLIESSITSNCGRSCINASGVWTPRHGKEIADALAQRLAKATALPADDPNASVAAFANPMMAEQINAVIDHDLRVQGAEDVTSRYRNGSGVLASRRAGKACGSGEERISGRLVKRGRCCYLLPTVVRCDSPDHPLANREFLFPFASVVECSVADMPRAIGKTLIVSALTNDGDFIQALMTSPDVDRLNIGPIPTWQLSWDQPHEGNLFEHLYRQRAFQTESAA